MRANTMISRLAMLALLIPCAARADFFLHHWEDHYVPFGSIEVTPQLLYYTTDQNFDATGNKSTPPGFQDAKRLEVDVLGEFGLMDRLSLFGRLSWAKDQMDVTGASGTSYGFADQSVGMDYRAYEKAPRRGQWLGEGLDLQFQVDFPAYTNIDTGSTPDLGDQTIDVTPGGFITLPVWQDQEHALKLVGGAGYTFRSSHFSAQVPWTIRGDYLPKQSGFFVGAAGFGTISLRQDNSVPTALPNGLLTGSGGSFLTGGIDSETVILRAEAGYQRDPSSQVLLAYEQSVWGEDAPVGSNVILGYRMSFGNPSRENAVSSTSDLGLQEYSMDAKVLRTNDRLNLVKIDKGSDDGISKGQVFDIFSVTASGKPIEAVARARVIGVKSDEAALRIIQYFKEVWINDGFIAKRLVQ